MFKLNFDGASKGNPGLAGYGGAIRNSEGNPVGIYWGYIGLNSNNVADLRGLLEGLLMAVRNGWLAMILDGDSQGILQMANKLLNGKPVSKVVNNWKMNNSLEQLRNMLHGTLKSRYIMCREMKTNLWIYWKIMESNRNMSLNVNVGRTTSRKPFEANAKGS